MTLTWDTKNNKPNNEQRLSMTYKLYLQIHEINQNHPDPFFYNHHRAVH